MIEMIGDIKASGFNVLSDEYSKPGFNILTLSSLLIVVESGNKLAFIPCVEAILTNVGRFSYPLPPKLIFTSLIPPVALSALVEYFKILVFDWS